MEREERIGEGNGISQIGKERISGNETVLEEEEIRVVGKMKRKKTRSIDGILMEVWKFAGKRLWNKLVKLLKRV